MTLNLLSALTTLAAGVPLVQAGSTDAPTSKAARSAIAQTVIAAFEAEIAPFLARFDAIRPDTPVAANILERVAVEQALREAAPDFGKLKLTPTDRQAVLVGVWSRIWAVDTANTAYLKSVLPADGWFRNSRDGDDATHGAWLLVQHSPDQAFMRTVVERMKPLAEAGEVRGADYALLFDRTEGYAGRPQYYGSQYGCKDGRYVPDPIRDAAGVEDRRRALGMSSMTENGKRLNERGC